MSLVSKDLFTEEVYVSLVSVQWTWHQKFSIVCTNWKATETSTTMTTTDDRKNPTDAQSTMSSLSSTGESLTTTVDLTSYETTAQDAPTVATHAQTRTTKRVYFKNVAFLYFTR